MTATGSVEHAVPPFQRVIPMVVATALFLENLDSTVVATALPSIARSLGESPVHLSLAITAYLLSVAIFMPTSGWMADRFGGRTVFTIAVGVFLAGSIACAFSTSIITFIAARLLQGAGGAMMVPVSRLILLRSIPKSDLVRAMMWFTMPALVGPIMGPPVGGFFTTYLSWHWVFWINVPLGLIGVGLVNWLVPPLPPEARRAFDSLGFGLCAIALIGLLAGFETAGRGLVAGWVSLALGLVGVTASLLYARHAWGHAAPLVNIRLFRVQTFRVSVLGGFCFRMGIGSTPFLLPLLFQETFGMSALMSGVISCAAAGGAFFTKTVISAALKRFGFRRVLMVSGGLSALMLAAMGLFTIAMPLWLIIIILFAGGVCRSLQFTSLNTLAVAEIASGDMSAATTLLQMGQQISRSLGVAIGALTLSLMVNNGALSTAMFWPIFAGFGAIGVLATLSFTGLADDVAADVSGQQPSP